MGEDEKERAITLLCQTVRDNLNALLSAAADGLIAGPPTVLELEAASGIGKSTIYRILDVQEKNDTSMYNLHALASCYGFQGWQLLRPKLNPKDPNEIAVALAVYQQIQRLAGGGSRLEPDTAGPPRSGAGNSGAGSHSSGKPKRPKAPRP